MKYIINENQRALVLDKGILKKVVGAGEVHARFGRSVEVLPLDEEISPESCPAQRIAELDGAKELVTQASVEHGTICLHYVDGVFKGILTAGNHVFWNAWGKHEFRTVSMLEPEVPADIAQTILSEIPESLYTRITVNEYMRAKLFYDGKFIRILGAGSHCFWNGVVKVSARLVDMREQSLVVHSQDILTADKVSVRVAFALFYHISDILALDCTDNEINQSLHLHAQLTLREIVGKYKMDEILENKDKISEETVVLLRAKTFGMPVAISSAGIRDIILPGEISEIMNSVLEAEKRAQANAITRREETAATRSLLNTAKLLDENATLRRLKELEYVERICAGISSISVDGRSGLLSELSSLLTGSAQAEKGG